MVGLIEALAFIIVPATPRSCMVVPVGCGMDGNGRIDPENITISLAIAEEEKLGDKDEEEQE